MKFTVDLHYLATAPGFWYLATPFSNYPEGHEAAWLEACRIRGELMLAGVSSYSPICETYQVTKVCGIGTDHHTWGFDNISKMDASHGIIVVMMHDWDKSAGVKDEMARFRERNKPVVFLDP